MRAGIYPCSICIEQGAVAGVDLRVRPFNVPCLGGINGRHIGLSLRPRPSVVSGAVSTRRYKTSLGGNKRKYLVGLQKDRLA
ncbi:MAG: hypothetical protein D3922_10315 [Candidatus Electrothrix sp. AR1]|nr:hypothetical protein [Candidatus Electrothrix sp. AR1]